jgi:hypothetical protein
MIFILLTVESVPQYCVNREWFLGREKNTKIHMKMGLSHRRVNVCALILGKIDRWRKASALHLDHGRTKSGPLAAFGRRPVSVRTARPSKNLYSVLNMFCQY